MMAVASSIVAAATFLEDGVAVLVARPEAVDVQHAESAHLAHLDRELGVDDAVHGGGDDRNAEAEVTEVELGRDQLGVRRHRAGNNGNIVEAVSVLQSLRLDRRCAGVDLRARIADYHVSPHL